MKEFDFNDDLSAMLDQSLSAPGLREEYYKNRNHGWMIQVEGKNLRDGLKSLSQRQIAIIEGFFFEDRCLEDICRNYCMSHEEIEQEISMMRIKLTRCL